MKIDYRPLVAILFATTISILLLVGMASCSPEYHKRKFIQKGGKLETKETEITIHDTLRINGKDSIITKTIHVDCPEMVTPPTRYEVRYKYKTLRDTLELIRYKTKLEYKTVVKRAKKDVKTNPVRQFTRLLMWAVFLVVGLFVFNWISKK